MLAFRVPQGGAFHQAHTSKCSAYIAARHQAPQAVVARGRRTLAVAVFAKKDHKNHDLTDGEVHSAELQAYANRERVLLAELAATRGQVDKLLDQQQILLSMVARLSGLSGPGDQPGARGNLASLAGGAQVTQLVPPAAPPPAGVAPPSWLAASPPAWQAGSSGGATTSGATSSSDVPAPSSLADLFRSAAAAAPNPASAAAAASVAAAIAAVDAGDVLSLDRIVVPPVVPPTPSAAPSPAAAAEAPVKLQQPALLFDTLGGFTVASAAPAEAQAPAEAEAEAEAPASDLPVEVAKAAPTDPPPDLVQGDDDIFWLSRLHAELEARGFFPGDDDMENWFFGEGTMAAVLSFQASEQLPETGVVDRATWTALLGQEVAEELFSRAPATQAAAAAAGPAGPSPSSGVVGEERPAPAGPSRQSARPAPSASDAPRSLDKWPVLMEGDGGREVHALQVALTQAGFYAGEDDMRWWQFGDTTLTALKFFQSCSGLPESGVCDERTWRALLGGAAAPADLYELRLSVNSDDEGDGFNEDLDGVSSGRVWLLGEQRWERRA